MWQLRMHCNLRQPDAAQSLCALISSPVPSSKSLSQSVAVLERFDCLYVTLRCDLELDPVTLTFDLWSWTLVVCRMYRGETLYEIWAQSGNPRQSYCSLNFDLMTLNMYHVLRYALRYFAQSSNSVKQIRHVTLWPWPLTRWPWKFVVDLVTRGDSCTKFDQNRTITGWVIHNLANFCPHYVSLWPSPLTPWPWSFVIRPASCAQRLCKIWAKSNNPRQLFAI